jgi:hypothetical protein
MNHDLEKNLSEDGFLPLGQFHQRSMGSFYARRSRKRNNSVKSLVSFYSARVGNTFGYAGLWFMRATYQKSIILR